MPSFEEILNKQADSIEAPKPYPVGTYLCLVDGLPQTAEIGKNKTPAVVFQLKIAQPQTDVDQSALAEFGVIAGKSLRHTLYATEESVYRLKAFLADSLGIEASGRSLKEMIADAPGKQVLATVRNKPSDDGQRIFSEIANTARV